MSSLNSISRRQFLPLICATPALLSCETSMKERPEVRTTSAKTLNIIQNHVPIGRRNRSQKKINPEWVTIHSTSNTGRTADALAHARFLINNGGYTLPSGRMNWVSWHFTVDDKSIVQHLPLDEEGYHCGAGNDKSIGIEICMNKGADTSKAIERAGALAAKYCYENNLPLKSVVQHHFWTTKNCPILLREDTYSDVSWAEFLISLKKEMDVLTGGIPRTPKTVLPPSLVNTSDSPDIDHNILEKLIT